MTEKETHEGKLKKWIRIWIVALRKYSGLILREFLNRWDWNILGLINYFKYANQCIEIIVKTP